MAMANENTSLKQATILRIGSNRLKEQPKGCSFFCLIDPNFISGIWQIHAFGEGNTRTTAVFTIKYLRTFGFDISNEAFANHSWYFRNALVRANYNNFSKGIYATTEYIEAFFRNLILSEHNELKNHTMLVQESSAQGIQSANSSSEAAPKCQICTLEKIAVLNFLREQPKATQKEIAAHIGKSERTVKTIPQI